MTGGKTKKKQEKKKENKFLMTYYEPTKPQNNKAPILRNPKLQDKTITKQVKINTPSPSRDYCQPKTSPKEGPRGAVCHAKQLIIIMASVQVNIHIS